MITVDEMLFLVGLVKHRSRSNVLDKLVLFWLETALGPLLSTVAKRDVMPTSCNAMLTIRGR